MAVASPTATGVPVATLPARATAITLAVGLAAVLAASVWSITVGASSMVDPQTAFSSLFVWDGAPAHVTVQSLRLPRVVVAVLVGASLAVAGALIQGVTRNPLAEPSIIGVNAGAVVVVAALSIASDQKLTPWLSAQILPVFAFVGAGSAAILVYGLASKGSVTPIRLALAGVAVATFFQSLTVAIVLLRSSAVRIIMQWMVGSLTDRTWENVLTLAPWAILGLLGALALAQSVTVLSLGDDVARGLGQDVERIRMLAFGLVVVLAGASVAVAGPIAMVGLIVPHVVRRLVGVDYRAVIPCAAVLGALLLIVADVIARLVAFPAETPVGVLTAVVGAPFLIGLARRETRAA
jgi:ABC-type Fe3+-siderophore transport system permease subunit